MTQKEKDILFKDLCMRLPYSVKVKMKYYDDAYELLAIYRNGTAYASRDAGYPIETYFEECKPYLFPLSSMTEEQKNELKDMEWSFDNSTICNILECFGTYRAYVDHSCCAELVEWCIKNKFDYCGLIPMGLAEDATDKNIY